MNDLDKQCKRAIEFDDYLEYRIKRKEELCQNVNTAAKIKINVKQL